MAGSFDAMTLSRVHFAFTVMFHIIWPVLTIGLSVFLVAMEGLWLITGQEAYYRHARFWGRLFLLGFGIGVASGVVMEFQFGANWSEFSRITGPFMGNILGFEAAIAFAAEASFVTIMLFGWRRVSRGIHMFATCMVALAASVSAFWIMDANSWMQTPAGTTFEDGVVTVANYKEAIFNQGALVSFLHMWVACLETGLFVLAGLSAWQLLKRRDAAFYLRSFKLGLVLAIIVTPLQVFLGDVGGRLVVQRQPEKAAAMESRWETNPPGQGSPWALLALPDPQNERNRWAVEIPGLLSVLATHTRTGQFKGLKEFTREDRPPVGVTFYAFRTMIAVGFVLLFLMLWTLWCWLRGWLKLEKVARRKWLLRAWVGAVPLGFIAVEAGWVVREVGRQPWIVYRMIRTADVASPGLEPGAVAWSLATYSVIYAVLLVMFIVFAAKLLREGPDMESEPPAPRPGVAVSRTGEWDDRRSIHKER